MSHTQTEQSWLDRLLHPDHIPPEALAGGLTPEQAWDHWCANKAAQRASQDEPHPRAGLSPAERWWFGRFDAAHLQERGAGLWRTIPAAEAEAGQ